MSAGIYFARFWIAAACPGGLKIEDDREVGDAGKLSYVRRQYRREVFLVHKSKVGALPPADCDAFLRNGSALSGGCGVGDRNQQALPE
ncbi:MAG: hypothetical protein LBK55_00230 [Azoarcus sp.]|nr:hypothetical protein [Azoarcus sp.]